MTGKKYVGAPFGTQTPRFDVSGVHPQSKMPGSYTQVPYCKKANTKENTLLGPGAYSTREGDFTPSSVALRAHGPNWESAHDMVRFNAIPHMLYRGEWEHKKELVKLMGPGKYEAKDFVALSRSKPSSSRGACQTKESRFPRENAFLSNLPGPGTYGKGGVPWAASEAKERKSTSAVGSMESPDRDYYETSDMGSGLAPCRYTFPSSTEEMLKKKVGSRGPYDLFSGDRYKVPQYVVDMKLMGPGKYSHKTCLDEWSDKGHIRHGEFSSLDKYPEQPTERIYCNTLSQCPRYKGDPEPGHYTRNHMRVNSAPSTYKPFNSTDRRSNKRTQMFFNGNMNPVGIGQYSINRWHEGQHVSGAVNVFTSKTPKLPPRVDGPQELLLNERLRPKGISATRRVFTAAVLEAPC